MRCSILGEVYSYRSGLVEGALPGCRRPAIERRLNFFFFQAEGGIRDKLVTGVQTCALPICSEPVWRPCRASWRAEFRVDPHPLLRLWTDGKSDRQSVVEGESVELSGRPIRHETTLWQSDQDEKLQHPLTEHDHDTTPRTVTLR